MDELEIYCDEIIKIESYGSRLKIILLNPEANNLLSYLGDVLPKYLFNPYCEHSECEECDR